MRSDRLAAILLFIQEKGRVTAAEVAEELDVSERTARRDLEALTEAGIPVHSTRGRGGGWSLIGDVSSFASLIEAGAAPTEPEVASDASILDTLQSATARSQQVKLGYQNPDGEAAVVMVQPLGLVTKGDVWFLVAASDTGQESFRVSQIQSVDLHGTAVGAPIGFDLDEAWKTIRQRTAPLVNEHDIRADVVVERWTMGLIRSLTATRLSELRELGDNRVHVEVSAPSIPVLAHGLAGFGPAVDVSGPPELLEALGELGNHLVDRYCDRPDPDSDVTG